MPYTVYLKKNEEKRLLAGHSWVFANEVAKIEGKDKNGSLATVCAFDGRFIGKGYINHASKILVRIFIRNNETDEGDFYEKRILEAWEQRKKLGFENCCRVVFGEADNLPALIVDKYADILAIQCLSLGIHQRKKIIVDALVKIFSPRGIFERSDVAVRAKEGLPEEKGVLYGEVPDEVIIEENGLKMSVDVKNGQKTGYFLDQKENRYALRRYAKGAKVLDCFCNSGGFSLNAAQTAKEVTAVDVSQFALDNVMKNAELNGLTNIKTEKADVFELLRQKRANGEKYDVVVLDPPAFTKTVDTVKEGYRGYKDVNKKALRLVKKGGFLVTCSCSQHMTIPLFTQMLREATKECGLNARLVELRIQSKDHATSISYDECLYLKVAILRID